MLPNYFKKSIVQYLHCAFFMSIFIKRSGDNVKITCSRCGVVNAGHKCPVKAKEQRKRDLQRQDKAIYWSDTWKKLRADILLECNHVCLWSLYTDGHIREATTCHHIVELMEDNSKAYDKDNLICLHKDAHDTVHELYKKDRQATMELLIECKKLWGSGVKLEGLFILKERLLKINNSEFK